MTYKEIGQRIKERRKELDITADYLAERIGLTRSTIFRYENGDIAKIKLPMIEAIAEVLRVNPLWLLGKSKEKAPNIQYDVCVVLDGIISDIKRNETVFCNGEPLKSTSKSSLLTGLEILRHSILK